MSETKLNWRWWAAATLFIFGFAGLYTGVGLSERPELGKRRMVNQSLLCARIFRRRRA